MGRCKAEGGTVGRSIGTAASSIGAQLDIDIKMEDR